MTGLGVALGDAFYSGLGLFGMATLITQCEEVFSLIKIVGGAYLLWFAWNSIRHHATPQMPTLQQPLSAPLVRLLPSRAINGFIQSTNRAVFY